MADKLTQEQSILASTKKLLGIEDDYPSFDTDIIIHINSVFAFLTQLGVGPKTGFEVVDRETGWVSYLTESPLLNAVRTFVYLKVRLVFDPPQTGPLVTAMEKQASEYEWRIHMQADTKPIPDPLEVGPYV